MIRIHEELILDEGTNATAKCTAIRTLCELQGEEPAETENTGEFREPRRPPGARQGA